MIAGGVLMATGVGGPAGLMLIAAGADTIIQKATTREVNWGEVALSGAMGGFGGAGIAAKAGLTGIKGVMVAGGSSGGISGGIQGAYSYYSGDGPHKLTGGLEATATSAAAGTVMGVAGGVAGHALAKIPFPKSWNLSPTTMGAGKLGDLSPVPEGIVYHRVDDLGGMKPYVGQAKSLKRFDLRQAEHERDFPDTSFTFRELGNAEPGTALDRLEETWIRELGGPTNKGNPDGLLSNKRHQMSETRYEDAGGYPW